jgi:hypothetical protein
MEYINHNTEENAKIYFLYIGKRGYYCDREYIFGVNIMKRLIERAKTSDDIHAGFNSQGITHILFYYPLFDKWLNDNFSEEKILLTQRFFRENGSILFVENGFGVLGLNGSNIMETL